LERRKCHIPRGEPGDLPVSARGIRKSQQLPEKEALMLNFKIVGLGMVAAATLVAVPSAWADHAADLAALEARVAALEGNLTPDQLAGNYVAIGVTSVASPLASPDNILKGIGVQNSSKSGTARVRVEGGQAVMYIDSLCYVGQRVRFLVGNNGQKNVVTKVTGEFPARDLDDVARTTNNSNPCVKDPYASIIPNGVQLGIRGSTVESVNPGFPLVAYTAAGGRIWVINNYEGGVNSTDPEGGGELIVLIKTSR
jgi:hypothetical protein